MRFSSLTPFLLLFACAPAAQEPPATPAAPEPAPLAPAPVVSQAPAPAPLSAEEQKAAEERKKLEADFAELEREHAAEVARLTPEIRAAAKKLAETGHASMQAGLRAALKSPHRRPNNPARDAARHPLETLQFFGVRANQTVLEFGPGEGWYTELLAPVLAKQGKLIAAYTDPAGPRDQRATFYGYRTKLLFDSLPEIYSGVESVVIDPKNPSLPQEGSVDVALVIRSLHGMYNGKTLNAWLSEIHQALKPNGVLGIVQHRADKGKSPDETSKLGYLPEAFVIEEVEKAGFKLLGKSEINANKKDTKDHPHGVWSLPPSLRGGDADRAKYVAIGESDRMTLKFAKRALPKTAAAPAAQPGAVTTATPGAKAPATPAAASTAPAAPAPATAPRAGTAPKAGTDTPAAPAAPPTANVPPAARPTSPPSGIAPAGGGPKPSAE